MHRQPVHFFTEFWNGERGIAAFSSTVFMRISGCVISFFLSLPILSGNQNMPVQVIG
ncbi:hypothetical protein DDI_1648 [Dickeya dianthicola RNS04.9]|nr:hypothetical protein DDI_1648 [Dickeya dianthicola RNS04.9]